MLLHPEGGVGWHGNFVAPLMPGAAEMALEALRRGRASDPGFQSWIAPVVWKLVFQRDVEAELLAECGYVERRLKIDASQPTGWLCPSGSIGSTKRCWSVTKPR